MTAVLHAVDQQGNAGVGARQAAARQGHEAWGHAGGSKTRVSCGVGFLASCAKSPKREDVWPQGLRAGPMDRDQPGKGQTRVGRQGEKKEIREKEEKGEKERKKWRRRGI